MDSLLCICSSVNICRTKQEQRLRNNSICHHYDYYSLAGNNSLTRRSSLRLTKFPRRLQLEKLCLDFCLWFKKSGKNARVLVFRCSVDKLNCERIFLCALFDLKIIYISWSAQLFFWCKKSLCDQKNVDATAEFGGRLETKPRIRNERLYN